MKTSNILFILLGVLLLVVLFFALNPSTKTSLQNQNNTSQKEQLKKLSTQPTVIKKIFNMQIENRKIISGSETLQVNQGDEVTFVVVSDEEDELHLHGYDKSIELTPTKKGSMTFVANVSGRFPFELENSKTELGTLEVQPK